MKTVGVVEAKKALRQLFETAQNEEVIIMRHGRPLVRVSGVRGRSMPDLIASETFWQQLAERARGPSTPIDEVWDRMGVPRRSGGKDIRRARGASARKPRYHED